MTVEEAIAELQRLDPKLELVTENRVLVTAIRQDFVPRGDLAIPRRKAVVFTSDPFTRPPLKS